ncbi:hypothetical protein [Bacillus sp. FJAT-28004]|uniref:hypothetical protein n=1 Tax=Bacillus sp. FJAT-28004 TaxID=1679165 RepID=UPI0013791EA1|nr:hypothetical protein [Bacillus sp. FJAT-28004]
MNRSSRTLGWQNDFQDMFIIKLVNELKSYRELRGGVTQSKLRFESRLGAERGKRVVI